VAGAGHIGRAHIDAIRAHRGAELAGIVDPSPESRQLADSLAVGHFDRLERLFDERVPDAVVIATPNNLHYSHAMSALEAKVAILLEKPLTASVADGEALVAAVAESKARLLVGHHRAHSAIMAKACETVASGVLGELVAIQGSAMFFKPARYFDEGPWRRETGGGPIAINLIHEIHNLRMLCGEISSVQAMTSHDRRGFAVEDTAVINLRFASGVLGTFCLSDTAACARSWEQTAGENPAYAHDPEEDCYVLAGTLGTLAIPTMRLKTYANADEASWWQPFTPGRIRLAMVDPIRQQMSHFVDVVRGQAEPRVSARDGLMNLRVTEAIMAAAACGCEVPVKA